MATTHGLTLPARESFMLESRSASSASTYPSSYRDYSSNTEDEEFPPLDTGTVSPSGLEYMSERTRRTIIGRILNVFGVDIGQRSKSGSKAMDYDYFTAARDELPEGLLSRGKTARETRRCRRTKLWTHVRRILVGLPIVLLLSFGVLHLIQATYGGAIFPWDIEDYDEQFLPDWGKPGHYGAGLAEYPTDATRDVLPIPCHSHNDYWRRVPFYEAIHWGCTSVEADVWLFDNELFVGHSKSALTRARTFRSLYVDPLTAFLEKMNPQTEFSSPTTNTTTPQNGVFDADPAQTLVLLVDFKTAGHETFRAVHAQLAPLRDRGQLSFWDGERSHSRAVTVVGTGNTPFDLVTAEKTHRDVFFDAPLDKLWEPPVVPPAESVDRRTTTVAAADGTAAPAVPAPDAYTTANSYYASVSFARTIGHVWRGHLTPRQLELLRGQIRGARSRGLKARYWDTPRWPRALRNQIWHLLMKEGANVLNVDDLRGAALENWRARTRHFWARR